MKIPSFEEGGPMTREKMLACLPGDPASDISPAVSTEDRFNALLLHYRVSRDQIELLEASAT